MAKKRRDDLKIGRNDPCPCGSGKKYKKCCLKRGPDPINYMKQKLDRFHERLVEDLFHHGAKVFDPRAMDEAEYEFFGWPDEDEVMDLEGHEAVFYPWYLFKWRIESGEESSLSGPRDQSIARCYLAARGRRLDPVEREYVENYIDAPLSFFEITAVEPGKSVSLKDLLLDRDYQVMDRSASQTLQVTDVLFGSVVEAGGIALFGAMGMVSFKPSAKVDILDLRQRMSMATQGQISVDTLEEYDLELRDLYLHQFMSMTGMPDLTNSDGDKLSFHSLKYTISSPRRVFDALKGLTNGFASEEELLEEAEFDENGELHAVEIPWLLPAADKSGGMENTLYGRLMIEGRKMTCEVNSGERALRLRQIIGESLPDGEPGGSGEGPPGTGAHKVIGSSPHPPSQRRRQGISWR